MKNKAIVIWVDTPVKIYHKCSHIHRMSHNWRKKFTSNDFMKDYGDLPIGTFNDITNKFEPCINTRGYGYAARKRLKYRKCKKYS